MATGKEWIEHFKTLTPEQLDSLYRALTILKSDSLLFREFSDSGLFNLRYFITDELYRNPVIARGS